MVARLHRRPGTVGAQRPQSCLSHGLRPRATRDSLGNGPAQPQFPPGARRIGPTRSRPATIDGIWTWLIAAPEQV